MSFDIYFFSASFCRNDENQFRVCVPSGNRTNAHPRLASRFITIPFQEIHNKRSFIFFDDERMAAAKPIYIYFFYFFFPFSFIYLFCSRVQCAAYRRILGFHIFEITVFARVLPRVIIVSPRKKNPLESEAKTRVFICWYFPGNRLNRLVCVISGRGPGNHTYRYKSNIFLLHPNKKHWSRRSRTAANPRTARRPV